MLNLFPWQKMMDKKSTKAVISQSMYFPWVGLLEQVRLADIFVHYDDVPLARGFYNRVQIKNSNGVQWMTIPLRNWERGQLISEVLVDENRDWKKKHIETLRHAYRKSPFFSEMMDLVEEVFSKNGKTLAEVSRESISALCRYFNLNEKTKFINSNDLKIAGASTQRLNDICLFLDANIYITGHGAKNYLDHEIFERSNIRVEYMNYQKIVYPQLHGDFTPYVSGLDLVANCGREGIKYIISDSIDWKKFINETN